MKDLLSIGQFANLCETTTDTLIHYHNIGLLSPSHTSDKNRRLYDVTQYYTFSTIQSLAETGLPLHAIKELIDSDSDDVLLESLKQQENLFKQRLFYLQNTIMYIDDMLVLSSTTTETTSNQPVIYMQHRPQNMFATLVKSEPSDAKTLIDTIKKHTEACKKESVYPFPIGYVIKKESPWLKDNKSFLLTSPLRTGMSDNRTLVQPAGQYAAILHKGSFDSISNSVQLLKQYINEHSFRILSDTYITIYHHLLFTEQTEMYLIKILIEPI